MNHELNKKNIELISRYKNASKSEKNKIILEVFNVNKPFINSITKGYSLNIKEDLLQECNIALYEAVESFDLSYSNFLTYATYKIQNRIKTFRLQNSNLVTNYSQRVLSAYNKYPDKDKSITEIAKDIGTTPNTIISAIKSENSLVYLDKQEFENILDKEDITEFDDFLTKDMIKKVIDSLNERERIIIINYFGFDTNPIGKTEIGKLFTPALKRQHVNNLYKRAINKIKKRLTFIEDSN